MTALVTPVNGIHHYHRSGSSSELSVDVDNVQNLERVPGAERYKVEGRYVKLTLGTASIWDNALQDHVEVSDAPKFEDVLFMVDRIEVHGEGHASYSMRLVPVDDSVDLTGFGDFNYSLESDESSWAYEDTPKIVPSGLVEGVLVYNIGGNPADHLNVWLEGDHSDSYQNGDRVVLHAGVFDGPEIDYELDGLVYEVSNLHTNENYNGQGTIGTHLGLHPVNDMLPNREGSHFHLDDLSDVTLYKVEAGVYVADTSDDDGDGVPNTWDLWPHDSGRIGDWDGNASSLSATPSPSQSPILPES
jgi:hypothetical protein